VLAREPRHLQARINHGTALAELGKWQQALADYNAALAVQPNNPSTLYNRGNCLRGLDRHAEALADYDRAVSLLPSYTLAWYNRGLTLQALNKHHDALASFGKALALRADYADAQFAQAASLLTLGDYPRGFAAYESRWKREGMGARRSFRQPLWQGQTPLAQKTILLHAEQGLGDTIQFVRYAPLLARAGAKVLLEVQPELKTLLSQMEGVSATFARGESLPAFDLQCPLAGLPLALKTEIATVPAEIPYLEAREEQIARWRPRLEPGPGRRIALAWSGRATHINDRNRSLTLAQLEPLLSVPDVRFFSIQHELRPQDAETLRRDSRITPLGDQLRDFTDTAAVLALADLVICVDTSVAHLAAAMGRPTWILLPFQPDWRWTLGEHSPWYPKARLFRQPAPGEWNSIFNRMREELASRPAPAT
jgi:tetratricopeptide (TPR) repeat protein